MAGAADAEATGPGGPAFVDGSECEGLGNAATKMASDDRPGVNVITIGGGDALDEDKVADALERMRQTCPQVAERLPTHGEFLARIRAPKKPVPPLPEFVF
jgi:hypothetical protein